MQGPPWLPRLPPHWRVVQMRRVVTFRNGADYKAVEVEEGGYPVYGSGGAFRRASSYLHDGTSVLFGRKGTIDRPLLVRGKFWTVDTMFFTELGSAIEPRFLHYYGSTIPYGFYSTSTAVPSMTQVDLGGHRMPLPPLAEQCAIADYLDRETAQIDTLIEEQQRLVDLLQERRVTTFATALDALGAPQTRLKHLASVQSGVTLSGEGDPDDPEWPYLRVANVQAGHVDLTEVKMLRLPAIQAEAAMLRPGDVLMTEGGDIDKLGRGAVWHGSIPDMIHQNHIFAVRPSRQLEGRFLEYWLDGPTARLYFRTTAKKTTNLTAINKWILGNLPIALPTISEQLRIADALDAQTATIDLLISETERFIELSQERCSALITAAVTGQIDVRGKVA